CGLSRRVPGRGHTPELALANPQSAIPNPQSGAAWPDETEASPRPAGDLGGRRRLSARTARRAAVPLDPRLLSQLGIPQGPPRTRRAPRRRRAPRSGGGDRAQGPGAARPHSRHRLVLPLPRQDDPQVLPLLPVRVEARRVRPAGGGGHHRLRVVHPRGGPPHDLLRQRARGAGASDRDGAGARPRRGRRRPGAARMTAVVPVFNPRAEPRRAALADAPKLLRLTDRLQLAAWDEVLRRVAFPTQTGHVAAALRVTREHLSREFAAGGAPNLKRVIDLARTACAADLLGNPGYTVRARDRKSTRLNSSHVAISYAVFCLKKKKK